MNKLISSLGVAAAIALGTSARAGELFFSYSEAGQPDGVMFSFEQASDPTPVSFAAGSNTVVPITDFSGTIPSADTATFRSADENGMFVIDGYELIGPQLYSGSEAAPHFSPLTVSDGFIFNPQNNNFGALTVTAVPEPATWALMLVGFGVLGVALRARSGVVGGAVRRSRCATAAQTTLREA